MELRDQVSDVDAKDFERPLTSVGGEVFNTKPPDHSVPNMMRISNVSSTSCQFFQARE